jgi:tetratricopeptide (TPR) repeat protein
MYQPRLSLFMRIGVSLSLFSMLVVAQTTNRNDPNAGTGGLRGNHAIRGKIFLPSGRLPEQRIRVVLELVSGGIYSETFSDSVGTFEFRSLPNNTYRIVVAGDGYTYETAQENLEVAGTIARTYPVQMYLREKESKERNISPNKMVSAAEFTQDVPKAAKKSYEQGLKKWKEGKADEAAGHFRAALEVFPDYVPALNKLGEFQVTNQHIAEAEATFRRALEISPKYPQTNINLGMLLTQLKRYPEAIEYLEAANKLDEGFPISHLHLGIALIEQASPAPNDLERAEKAFNKALALGGAQLAPVHKYLFNIHVRRNDYAKAVAALEAYLKVVPNAPDAPQVQEMIARVKKAATAQAMPK